MSVNKCYLMALTLVCPNGVFYGHSLNGSVHKDMKDMSNVNVNLMTGSRNVNTLLLSCQPRVTVT